MTDKKNIAIWVKRILSLLSIAYGGLMVFLAYTSLYYNIEITQPQSFAALSIVLMLVFGTVMLYTRKQFLTSVAGLFGLILYLPTLVFFYSKENMILLIPLGIVTLLVFFFSGAGEGLKTIAGTIYLLLYIICILAYYLYVSVFSGHTVDVIKQTSVSQTGNYRCYVLDITDSSKGTTQVVVEPNTMDIEYSNIKFIEKGYKRTIYNVRQNNLELNLEWKKDDKDGDVLLVNNEVRFKESDANKEDAAYRYFVKSKRQFKFLQ